MNRVKVALILMALLVMGISSVYACPLHAGGNSQPHSEQQEEEKPAQA